LPDSPEPTTRPNPNAATPAGAKSPSPLVWVFLTGAIGFTAGFIGPMALGTGNQGPLGIYVTGPGGLLLGLIFYAIARAANLRGARAWQLLWLVNVAMVAAALVLCQPLPAEFRGSFMESQIQSCQQSSHRLGVELEVTLLRSQRIYEGRRPWNRGQVYASAWRTEQGPASYHAGQRIRNYIRPGAPPQSGKTQLEGIPREFVSLTER
jgi:hypothetical protein